MEGLDDIVRLPMTSRLESRTQIIIMIGADLLLATARSSAWQVKRPFRAARYIFCRTLLLANHTLDVRDRLIDELYDRRMILREA